MKLNPYLAFDGRCREAFEFYEKALGGKITFIQTTVVDQFGTPWIVNAGQATTGAD